MSKEAQPIRLFISHDERDTAMRGELDKRLTNLRRQFPISTFYAAKILPGSDRDQAAAAERERAHLFLVLVSADFLASDYLYEQELARALARRNGGQAWLVPVLLRPATLEGTPLAALASLPHDGRPITSWSSADEAWLDVETGLRRLLDELSSQGRAPAAGPAAPVDEHGDERHLGAVVLGHDRRSLFVDRSRQWGDLQTIIGMRRHEVILLPGERGQGHEYFMLRVRMDLPRDPPRRIVQVQWKQDPFPRTRKDYLGALAVAIGCETVTLSAELSRQLGQRNLVLLHPCVRDGLRGEGFDDDAIVRYYSEYLPELLDEIRAQGSCKVLQPIEWRAATSGHRAAARLLRVLLPGQPRWVRRAFAAERARRTMEQLERAQNPRLKVYRMREFEDISRADVLDFCQKIGMPAAEQPAFADSVMSGARTSFEIIKTISDYLPREDEP